MAPDIASKPVWKKIIKVEIHKFNTLKCWNWIEDPLILKNQIGTTKENRSLAKENFIYRCNVCNVIIPPVSKPVRFKPRGKNLMGLSSLIMTGALGADIVRSPAPTRPEILTWQIPFLSLKRLIPISLI